MGCRVLSFEARLGWVWAPLYHGVLHGRYKVKDTNQRLKAFLETMMRMKNAKTLDSKSQTLKGPILHKGPI